MNADALKIAKTLPAPVKSEARSATITGWLRHPAVRALPADAADAVVRHACHLQAKAVAVGLLRAFEPGEKYDESLAKELGPEGGAKRGAPTLVGMPGKVISCPVKFADDLTPEKRSEQYKVSRVGLPKQSMGSVIIWIDENTFVGVAHTEFVDGAKTQLVGDGAKARDKALAIFAKLAPVATPEKPADASQADAPKVEAPSADAPKSSKKK